VVNLYGGTSLLTPFSSFKVGLFSPARGSGGELQWSLGRSASHKHIIEHFLPLKLHQVLYFYFYISKKRGNSASPQNIVNGRSTHILFWGTLLYHHSSCPDIIWEQFFFSQNIWGITAFPRSMT